MSFKCPQCGDFRFGSSRLDDGTLRRFCSGHTVDGMSCTFNWHESDDARYGLVPPADAAVEVIATSDVGPPLQRKVEVIYFKESGKYYTDGTFWSSAKNYYDVVDELQEMFAKCERPGLISQDTPGPGEFIALVTSKHRDGNDDVPHIITQASHLDYMAKKPARQTLRLRTKL